jgi:ABC-type transport system involved in cytochrome bd biosynthesis fused ATPase/permease subunit
LTGSIPGAEAAGTIAAIGMLGQRMRELGSVWDRYCAWSAARARCLELFAVRPLPRKAVSGRPKPNERCGVRVCLSNVSGTGIRRIRAVAEPAQKIGVTGLTGAGKSSLLRLIAGLERPLRGRVELDHVAAVAWVASVKNRVLYIGPGSAILSGSLRRVLTMGAHPRPNDDEIEAVARNHGLDRLLKQIGGLDGRVAEGGRNLSSGEIRRVLLARAVLSRADLLLLDDAYDALDGEGNIMVRNLIETSSATVFVVSHDRALLRSMDRVWQLERGTLTVTEVRSPNAA